MNDWNLSRLKERNQRLEASLGQRVWANEPPGHAPWPVFEDAALRNAYLDRLVANCYQVKALDLSGQPPRYTVEDIDRRKGT